jgi:protein-S-isoprenylcysteine O-methyltransferase Ste14
MTLPQSALLIASWLLWMTPFFLMKRNRERAAQVDKRARGGIVIQSLAYCLLWQSDFWNHPLPVWRMALAGLFFAVGVLLVWDAIRVLGRQWRLDAGLNADHELVRSGPYRVVRHPIYASMLCMLCGTGSMVAPLPFFAASVAVFLVGTEIRVRVEDSLLASRFGGDFRSYQAGVAAYIPFIR